MVRTNNTISLALMLLSSSLITFGSLARKYLINIDSVYTVMFVCFVGGSVLMWWIVSITSFQRIAPVSWKSILIRVFLGLFAQVLFFVSLSGGSLLITILLFNTSPLFIPVIRFIFLKKGINYFNLSCIIVSFFGIYLILGTGNGGVDIYALSALFAGVLNAASQVVLHNASQKEDVFIMNLWIYTFIGLLMIIFLPFNISAISDLNNIFTQPIVIWICIAIIIFSISSQIFRVKAFKYTKDPSFIAPGMYFSVVVAAILDRYMYHTHVGFVEILGIVIVCFSSILSVIKKQ